MTESKKEEIRCFHNFLKENNLEETKLLRNVYSDAFAHGFGEGVCLASKKANYDLKKLLKERGWKL